MHITPIFRWYDLWVGLFYDRKGRSLYFFPLPTLGLKFEFSRTSASNKVVLSNPIDPDLVSEVEEERL